MHWFFLIPFYVFTAIGVFLALTIVCRILRLKVLANTIAVTAVFTGIVVVGLPLLEGVTLAQYTGVRLLIVGGITFVLAAIDTMLEAWLPLPLDAELAEL